MQFEPPPVQLSTEEHYFRRTTLVQVDIISVLFIPEFVAENHTHFTNLNSFKIENKMLSKHSQKNYFSENMFLLGVRKNICTAPFPDVQELLSWSPLKANVCIFLYISLKKFCFKDIVRFYLVIRGIGEGWIVLWMMAHCLALVKYFTIFHFNWNLSKFHYFSVFLYFHQ